MLFVNLWNFNDVAFAGLQVCAAFCEGSPYFGTEYGNEVNIPVVTVAGQPQQQFYIIDELWRPIIYVGTRLQT